MNLTIAILVWLSLGAVAGWVAWAVARRSYPFGAFTPIMLGVVGSVTGGVIGWALPWGGPLHPVSWALSILGAIGVVALFVVADRKEHKGARR